MGAIQSHIDVYVSEATLGEVNRAFPYMVSKEFASGGGDVGSFADTRYLKIDLVSICRSLASYGMWLMTRQPLRSKIPV